MPPTQSEEVSQGEEVAQNVSEEITQQDFANPVSTEQPQKRHKWRRLISIVFSLLAFLVFIFFNNLPLVLDVFTSDIPPIDDSDLVPEVRVVPDEQNGYFLMKELNAHVDEAGIINTEIRELLDGTIPWDEKKVLNILQKGEKALLVFQEIADKQYFQDPVLSDPATYRYDTELVSMGGLRTVAYLFLLKADYEIRMGNEEESIKFLLLPLIVSNKISQPNTTMIAYLVGLAMKGKSYDVIINIMSMHELGASTTASLLTQLQQLDKDEGKQLADTMRGEYMMLRGVILDGFSDTSPTMESFEGLVDVSNNGKIENQYWYRPNETQLLYAEMWRANIRIVEAGCIAQPEIINYNWELPSTFQLMFMENAIGKIIFSVSASSIGGLSDRCCNMTARHILTEVALAITTHQTETGVYPNSLEVLNGKYFTSIPIDPFSGEIIQYDSKTHTLYSWGEDRVDDGGTGDDIVVQL